MTAVIEEEVVVLDAAAEAASSRAVLRMLSSAVDQTDSGVVDVFRVLVRDDLTKIGGHGEFYERLMHSALNLKVLIRCTTGSRSVMELSDVRLPSAIVNNPDRVRLLVLEDNIGVYFSSERATPDALAIWPNDVDGSRTVEIVEDALRVPEIFSEVFTATLDKPYRAYSVGTRQAWFGRFPVDAIRDAFREVALSINGGDSFSALEPRPPEWEVPQHLSGRADEPDLLLPGKGLSLNYAAANKAITSAYEWYGLKTGHSVPKRVARSNARQLQASQELSDSLRFVDQTVGTLISSIEASDGFDGDEPTQIEEAGIQLWRSDDARQRFKTERTLLLQRVVQAILDALANGQSVAPYFGKIDRAIKEITPKTRDEIREEFETKKLTPLTERLDDAARLAPAGPAMAAARRFATLFAEPWFRSLAAFLGGLGLLGLLDHIFDDQTPNLLMNFTVLSGLRQELRIASEVIFVVVLLGVVGGAFLLSFASSELMKWGRSLGLDEIQQGIVEHERFIRRVALNDWILSKPRRSAIDPLSIFRDSVLREVLNGIQDVLIDGATSVQSDYDNYSFNPAVRRTFQAGAQIGIFKNLEQVKSVLGRDVIWLVKHPIEAHIFSLLGSNANDVGRRIVLEIRETLQQYVKSVVENGVYSSNHLKDQSDGERERQKLIENYWDNADAINELLHGIVLMGKSEPMVQFVQAESIGALDTTPERAVLIRFAPRTSKLEELVSSAVQRETLSDVTFTKSAEIGGVLRLIGYREGTIGEESLAEAGRI